MIQDENRVSFETPAAPQLQDKCTDNSAIEQARDTGEDMPGAFLSMADADGFDPVSDLQREADGLKGVVGNLRVRTANETMAEAFRQPDPVSLYNDLWFEGETCCLFADTNVGKSIYAVQIAEHIAATRRVLYVDCELSGKQFQTRYTDQMAKTLHNFPQTFFRAELTPGAPGDDSEEGFIKNIETAAVEVNAPVVIIDNLSFLCNASEKGDVAGLFMKRLTALKRVHGWSLLVIAHTPKRRLFNPITQNDLAGSKKLMNFFDSAFAIGQSAQDPSFRYVKQTKVRATEFKYTADNVMVYELTKANDWLHFEFRCYGKESDHLSTFEDRTALEDTVAELHREGKSIRQIAEQVNKSKSTVHNILKAQRTGANLFTEEATYENVSANI